MSLEKGELSPAVVFCEKTKFQVHAVVEAAATATQGS